MPYERASVSSTPNDADLNTAFPEAASRGSREALERLLAQGADVNARTGTGKAALMRLRCRGERNPPLARLLLNHDRTEVQDALDRQSRIRVA